MILKSHDLNFSPVQQSIIEHNKGHLRIIACPGSGKTEVVSQRVAELIKNGVEPAKIVSFTFTRKAAEGLKLRIRKALETKCKEKSDFGDMYIGTIDSFCLHILKKLKPEFRSFEVLDDARGIAFIDRWFYKMGFKELQGDVGKWKTIKMFRDSAGKVMMERIDVSKISNKIFVKCFEEYKKTMREQRFFDFSTVVDTLLETLNDKDAMRHLGEEVKHVVFDEYQDVNKLQEELLEKLSEGADSVCVVGDDDQNIFQWRGSNVEYIIDFEKKYKKYGAVSKKLDINYRSTDGIVSTAENFITNNSTHIPKNMKPYDGQTRKFERGDIMYNHFDNDEQEFEFIFKNIQNLLGTDFTDKHGNKFALSYRDMAILVSSNEDAARIIKYLRVKKEIPCIADSGSSVFDRSLVKFAIDCICYVFGCPGYTTGDDVPELSDLLRRYSEIIPFGDLGKFEKGILEVKKRGDSIIDKGNSDWLPNLGLQEFYHRILNAMGAENMAFKKDDLYFLAVLSSAISDYEYVYQTLRAREVSGFKWFLSQYAESSYSDPTNNNLTLLDAVKVMTIWKAKGLEFPVVFVPTFVKKGKFPPSRSFVDAELYNGARYRGNDEDDRRSYYTAITRSQKYLFLSGAKHRRIFVSKKPSVREIYPHKFVDEMKNKFFSPMMFVKKPKSKNPPMIQDEGTLPTSYSDLSIYERCPYDYQLRHVMGFNAGVPAAFGYGTNIHNILNLIHSDYIQQKKVPSDDDIDNAFDRMFYLRFAPGMQNENMKKAGAKVVKNYVDSHKDEFERILDTEKRFEFVLGNALISGDIDLLKKVNAKGEVTEIEIIDFKTDKQREDGKYNLDYSEQVRFYAYATRMSLPYKPEKASIHHLDTQKKEEVDIGDDMLNETAKKIEKKVNGIVSENFDATPDETKCQGCDFRSICSHKGFDVGVNFKPSKSTKKDSSTRKDDDFTETETGNLPTKPSVISTNMKKKAENLARKNTTPNSDGTFQITSGSDSSKSYRVTDKRCECRGFRDYKWRHPDSIPTCSHLEATKIFKSKNNS